MMCLVIFLLRDTTAVPAVFYIPLCKIHVFQSYVIDNEKANMDNFIHIRAENTKTPIVFRYVMQCS